MNEDLTKCLELSVPIVSDVATIADNMEVLDAQKTPVVMGEGDKKEIATIFLVKGGLTGLMKKAKEMEEMVKEVGSPWMLARGVKTIKLAGIGTLSLTEGVSVSISQDALRKVLVNYMAAEKVAEVLEKVVKKTTYTTLQFKAGRGE